MCNEYDELIGEWNQLQRRRLELFRQPPQSGVPSERDRWRADLELIEHQREILELAIGAHEVLLSSLQCGDKDVPSCE